MSRGAVQRIKCVTKKAEKGQMQNERGQIKDYRRRDRWNIKVPERNKRNANEL